MSVRSLPQDHHAAFARALRNVLYQELTGQIMAQLVDGLPTRETYLEGRGLRNLREHPIHNHKVLCEGALERTKAFRSKFEPSTLLLKSSKGGQSIEAFKSCPPDTREFDLRLLELLAEAVHSIAVFLFNLEEKSHVGDIQKVVNHISPPEVIELEPGDIWTDNTIIQPFPTLFTCPCYSWHENYPNGVADVAAYWAEDKIFGGCKNVYLHSNRMDWTYRVWSLLDTQFQQLMEFLKGDPGTIASPFPLCADEDNEHRYDPYDAMKEHNIYRDVWERKLPEEKDWSRIRHNTFDYPELKAMFRAVEEAEKIRTEELKTEHGGGASKAKLGGISTTPGSHICSKTSPYQGTANTAAQADFANMFAGCPRMTANFKDLAGFLRRGPSADMAVQSSVQSATNIPIPPDRSKNPVEKLAYELLCQEYRSRYTSLSNSEKNGFRRVLGNIVIKRSMTTVSRHKLGDLRIKRVPTLAEFELLAILYGVRGCARCRWFRVYAAYHPDVFEPRFRGIIPQIDKSILPRILQKRQPMPEISMDKVLLENLSDISARSTLMLLAEAEQSPTDSTSRQTLISLSQSLGPSASSGSVPVTPATSLAAVGADVDTRSNCTTEDDSRTYVEEILAPMSNVSSTSPDKPPADLAQVVAELQSRVAHNTTAVLDIQNALEQFKERIISLGNSLHTIETKSHQMGSEMNSLGISHYTLRQEQTELQRCHSQLLEAMRAPTA
ncbi:hypothetical protein E4U55_004362 [Claviceps digitariae]|nr:hypothetical protein E4U55_004362 [Claviceps digitariae]